MCQSLDEKIKTARGIFYKMPNQLFDAYIKQFILQVQDWPFISAYDSTNRMPWVQLFCAVSLFEQASCRWEVSSFIPCEQNISKKSLEDIEHTLSFTNVYDIEYSRKSIEYHVRCLKEYGTFNSPVVLYPQDSKYYILDGIHRTCAALLISETTSKSCSIPAWIARV